MNHIEPPDLAQPDLRQIILLAISEDLGAMDITADLVNATETVEARIISRESAIVCGQPWVDAVFAEIDAEVDLTWLVQDGDEVSPDQVLFSAQGRARSILTAERTALNFLQTLSGTATHTARLAKLITHTQTRLLDTRKTLPGLRRAQKYAVLCGGGANHRMGLFDAFLIKENHIRACGSIAGAISTARKNHPDKRVEIEVENLHEFRQAVDASPDWIMLDNFSLDDLTSAIASLNQPIKLEASGGIESEDDLVRIAETGVDYISVGALTKHLRAVDLSMRLL
jgi:nicotinate-nucleotide pyrophosphorylase (carboxylating)